MSSTSLLTVAILAPLLACGDIGTAQRRPELAPSPEATNKDPQTSEPQRGPARPPLLRPHPVPSFMLAGTSPSCQADSGTLTPEYREILRERAERGRHAEATHTVTADLDGDGRPDVVEFRREKGETYLSFGDEIRWLSSGGSFDPKMAVVDLDPSDGKKEVVVKGSVYRLLDGKLTLLPGGSSEAVISLGDREGKREHMRVTLADDGEELLLQVQVGEESIGARIARGPCRPNQIITPLPEGKGAFIHMLGQGGHRQLVLLRRSEAGRLVLHRPWRAANTWDVNEEGILVTHWHCGRRHDEQWRLQDDQFVSIQAATSGAEDSRMCGRAKLEEADLDGDGTRESIALVERTLRVGKSVVEIPEKVRGFRSPWEKRMPTRGALSLHGLDRWKIVDIDTSDEGKELLLSYNLGEDFGAYLVYHYDGVALRSGPVLGPRGPHISGDGRVRLAWGNCGHGIEQIWRLKQGHLKLQREKKVGRFNPEECQACPFVYRGEGGAWHRKGEILRRLIGSERNGWQSLKVGSVDGIRGDIKISVREEKPETTYLDAVYLSVGEEIFLPRACDAPGAAPYCSEDGDFALIQPGGAIELEFVVPEEATGEAILWAKGYYVPSTR